MTDCERGRVKHPASHLEIAQMSDDAGRYTRRTYVCRDHLWTRRHYNDATRHECHTVTRRKL